ncbi:phage head closure protein [Leisingera daeponensis]|uniref:Phage head closure protein n=1 Tax=Leisingera daeponensis TaxID=405746 RepID=A0ABS7NBH3_9RHOB|nr:phage head closure protein [Leisingera daeponensis]MBY6138530.1 phage head closure protein [Leisingera daeponensis]
MAAGKYRDLVEFQRKGGDGGRDQYGNLSGDWEDLFEARGWLRQTPGKEQVAAGRLEATATATLRVRSSLSGPAWGVKGGDRVRVRGWPWDIKAAPIDPDGRGETVEFLLERGEAAE